jgi:hypothetical protein
LDSARLGQPEKSLSWAHFNDPRETGCEVSRPTEKQIMKTFECITN